jgi:hypothetical protein
MPTFIAYKKGEKIETITGAVPAKITVSSYRPLRTDTANIQALLEKVSTA